MLEQRTCSIPDCNRPFYGRNRCKRHYMLAWKAGELRPLPQRTAEDRFWAKVEKTAACWLWTGSLNRGYGHFHVSRGSTTTGHRFAYELLVGPVPDGLELDHICKIKRCVNPAHLEPVPHIENSRRKRNTLTRRTDRAAESASAAAIASLVRVVVRGVRAYCRERLHARGGRT